jgi:uncharacterized protein YlxW (UPF0749 family)
MSIDKRWFLLLAIAVGAAAGAVVASTSRRRQQRTTRDLERTTELKSWENEGGNLAPAAVSPAQP